MAEEKEPRILIVDDDRSLARALRSSLEMLERGYIVSDVPSGEEAMLETGRTEFDLIVCDYFLPGMSGLELIGRVRGQIPDIKALVITGRQVEFDDQMEALGIIDVLHKPIEVEHFVEVVQRTLHGERVVIPPAIDDIGDKLGPMPEFDKAPVLSRLSSLQLDLGASAVALVDRTGQLLVESGLLEGGLRFDELSVLLAHNLITTAEIATYLGEGQAPSALHYYEGEYYDIYALSVGAHFFVAIVFPGGSQNSMGPVMRYGRRAAAGILEMIGQEPVPATQPSEPAVEPAPAAEEQEEEPVSRAEPAAEEAWPDTESEVNDLDLGALDPNLEGEAPDADAFWEQVAEEEATKVRADAISLEEAIELGLIPDDLDLG